MGGGNPNLLPLPPASCATCGGYHTGRACHRETGACFLCGQIGHRAKDCTVQPGNRGGNNAGNGGPRNTGGRVFALTANQAAQAPGTVSGTLFVGNREASVLFDTGSTHSIVALSFARHLGVSSHLLDPHLSIATPMGNSVIISEQFQECPLKLGRRVYVANLLPMVMYDFDIILGMDWLSKHRATIDCLVRKVIFGTLEALEFEFQCSKPNGVVRLILALKASKMVAKGCDCYLAHVKDTLKDEPQLEDYPVVREFPEIFPKYLPGLPPSSEVEFTIELISGAEPISKAPYKMAPLELQELKEQLQKLLDRGFIRPSVSPWGAPVLFMKKKDGSMRLCIYYRELN